MLFRIYTHTHTQCTHMSGPCSDLYYIFRCCSLWLAAISMQTRLHPISSSAGSRLYWAGPFFLLGKIFRGSAVLKIFWHMARARLSHWWRIAVREYWWDDFVLFCFPSSCSWCCCYSVIITSTVEIFRGCFFSRLASMILKEVVAVSIWDSTLLGIFHMCASLSL